MNRTLLALPLILLSACGEPETGTIRPQLAFAISEETGLTNARDLTVDASGNVLVFDYDDYLIYKFSPAGEVLATFGTIARQLQSEGLFRNCQPLPPHTTTASPLGLAVAWLSGSQSFS